MRRKQRQCKAEHRNKFNCYTFVLKLRHFQIEGKTTEKFKINQGYFIQHFYSTDCCDLTLRARANQTTMAQSYSLVIYTQQCLFRCGGQIMPQVFHTLQTWPRPLRRKRLDAALMIMGKGTGFSYITIIILFIRKRYI